MSECIYCVKKTRRDRLLIRSSHHIFFSMFVFSTQTLRALEALCQFLLICLQFFHLSTYLDVSRISWHTSLQVIRFNLYFCPFVLLTFLGLQYLILLLVTLFVKTKMSASSKSKNRKKFSSTVNVVDGNRG